MGCFCKWQAGEARRYGLFSLDRAELYDGEGGIIVTNRVDIEEVKKENIIKQPG